MIGWVIGVQLLNPIEREIGAEHRPRNLGTKIAPEVPGHHSGPVDRVERCPWLDLVVGVDQIQHGILQTYLRAGTVGQVGVDSLGVEAERRSGHRVTVAKFDLGQVTEPQRPEELVGVHLAFAEHLGQARRADVPEEVHLPEPVLCLDVTLGEVEIVGVPRVDVGDPVAVSDHLNRLAQPGHSDLSVDLRERSSHQEDAVGTQCQDQHQ